MYNIPTEKNMAIIIPYFNFVNSINIRNNLLTVKDSLEKSQIPFFIGEILYNNQKSLFNNEFNIFSFHTNSIMFYKEHLVNLIESKINHSFKYICILDADIIFENKNWYNDTIKILETVDICQPFENAIWLNKDKTHIKTNKSILFDNITGHPGFVWALRRDLFKIFDLCLIGGGDRILSHLILKKRIKKKYITKCATEFQKTIKHTIKYSYLIKDTIYHLYHGSIEKRQYFDRENIMMLFLQKYTTNFDISQLITINGNEVYEWKEKFRNEINIKLLQYFQNRKDDE